MIAKGAQKLSHLRVKQSATDCARFHRHNRKNNNLMRNAFASRLIPTDRNSRRASPPLPCPVFYERIVETSDLLLREPLALSQLGESQALVYASTFNHRVSQE